MAEGLERIYDHIDRQRQAIARLYALGHISEEVHKTLMNKLLPFLEALNDIIENKEEIDEPTKSEHFEGHRVR